MSPSLIIADYHLDNMTFSGFCKEVQKLDTLADTYIISLVSPSDRLDEKHLRSLGVKAFLKKPFQSENLLDVIKDLSQHPPGGNGKKRRSWPPESSSTDSEDDLIFDSTGETEPTEEDTGQIVAPQIPPPPVSSKPAPPPARKLAPVTPKSAEEPADPMKGLFAQLLHTMTERVEEKLSVLMPQFVGKELAAQVAKSVQDEVQAQLGATLSQERLMQAIEPLLARELSTVLSQELPGLEPIIRHSIFEIASPLVKDNIDELIREQAATVKKTLPDVLHEHMKSIDVLVRDEIQEAAIKQATKIADEVVQAAVKEQIEQAIQRIVPGIAEEQIKAELKRLTTIE
jgi:CheY-like chemotaxis protein